MKVFFKTNIDAYKSNWFPENLQLVPHIGEFVRVKNCYINHLQSQKLPTRLEVKNVEYTEDYVICDLWYNSTDKQIADISGAKTL